MICKICNNDFGNCRRKFKDQHCDIHLYVCVCLDCYSKLYKLKDNPYGLGGLPLNEYMNQGCWIHVYSKEYIDSILVVDNL